MLHDTQNCIFSFLFSWKNRFKFRWNFVHYLRTEKTDIFSKRRKRMIINHSVVFIHRETRPLKIIDQVHRIFDSTKTRHPLGVKFDADLISLTKYQQPSHSQKSTEHSWEPRCSRTRSLSLFLFRHCRQHILSFTGGCHRQPVQIRRRRKQTECDVSSTSSRKLILVSRRRKRETCGRVSHRICQFLWRFRGRNETNERDHHPEIIFEKFVARESHPRLGWGG